MVLRRNNYLFVSYFYNNNLARRYKDNISYIFLLISIFIIEAFTFWLERCKLGLEIPHPSSWLVSASPSRFLTRLVGWSRVHKLKVLSPYSCNAVKENLFNMIVIFRVLLNYLVSQGVNFEEKIIFFSFPSDLKFTCIFLHRMSLILWLRKETRGESII